MVGVFCPRALLAQWQVLPAPQAAGRGRRDVDGGLPSGFRGLHPGLLIASAQPRGQAELILGKIITTPDRLLPPPPGLLPCAEAGGSGDLGGEALPAGGPLHLGWAPSQPHRIDAESGHQPSHAPHQAQAVPQEGLWAQPPCLPAARGSHPGECGRWPSLLLSSRRGPAPGLSCPWAAQPTPSRKTWEGAKAEAAAVNMGV